MGFGNKFFYLKFQHYESDGVSSATKIVEENHKWNRLGLVALIADEFCNLGTLENKSSQ